MSDLETAKQLFAKAGLAFPVIPDRLAAKLKKHDDWVFSTRQLEVTPYHLDHFVAESGQQYPSEYAVLAHSGHGVNSYAIQYYLVCGPMSLFLHLGWGGVYMDADATASHIQECFALADQLSHLAMTFGNLPDGERLTIVGSDFYGSYWFATTQGRQDERRLIKSPTEALKEALAWLERAH